jgi:phospholipid N-methyltransferase
MMVLEPSAGKGAILRELPRGVTVVACELNALCYPFLKEEFPRVALIEGDYLETTLVKKFDRIIANPPFTKNQDIAHIRKMYEDCRSGGRIVTIASKHWEFAIGCKEELFRQWLEKRTYSKHDIEAGAFKESGTMVGTTILVIDKDMED